MLELATLAKQVAGSDSEIVLVLDQEGFADWFRRVPVSARAYGCCVAGARFARGDQHDHPRARATCATAGRR